MDTKTKKSEYRLPEITGGMFVGFIVGFAISAMLASFIAWVSLGKRQKELAAEYGLSMAVIVTEPIAADEPLDPKKLAQRAIPQLVVSPNAVLPTEVDPLFGKRPAIAFERGDLLLRSAFGLEPRTAPAPPAEGPSVEQPVPAPAGSAAPGEEQAAPSPAEAPDAE